MGENDYTDGLIVKGHGTVKKHGKAPVYKVVLKSMDEKITLNLVMPDLGSQIFQRYPLGDVVEMVLKDPSQVTLDRFNETENPKNGN